MTESPEIFVFEHPLNEKTRTKLRLEYLAQQLNHHQPITELNSAISFFHIVSDLLDILERTNFRTELRKDLEIQLQKLLSWKELPGINTTYLVNVIQKIKPVIEQLDSIDRFGGYLSNDPLIKEVRRRLVIPGGYFSFDLPTLALWLTLPQQERDKQVQVWLESLHLLYYALDLNMGFMRDSCEFVHYEAHNTLFHRDNFGEYELLRVQMNLKDNMYPKISGNQTRFAIRFTPFDASLPVPEPLYFSISCC